MRFLSRRIPVLMYHRVSQSERDFLTITVTQLQKQFDYLKRKDFTPIFIRDWLNFQIGAFDLPKKPIILTFDDAHISFATETLSSLQKFEFKATLFVPTNLLGTHHVDCGEIMSLEMLKNLQKNNSNIELGLHTHNHFNLTQRTDSIIESEIFENSAFFKKNGLVFTPVLAYPYGARPTNFASKNNFIALLKQQNVEAAFRIGNRLTSLKIKERFDINRLDMRGTDSFRTFLLKINFGKLF